MNENVILIAYFYKHNSPGGEFFLYLATYCFIKIWNNYGKKRKLYEWNLAFEEDWYSGSAGKVSRSRETGQ